MGNGQFPSLEKCLWVFNSIRKSNTKGGTVSRDNLFLIKTIHKGFGLFCRTPINQHDAILVFQGEIMPMEIADAKRSVQVSDHFALELPHVGSIENFINHSCRPNCWLDFMATGIPTLRALRDIKVDEELCYNYNSVEYNLLDNFGMFHCRCDHPGCLGRIEGYLHLTPQQQGALYDTVAPYIKEKHEKN